MSWGPRWRTEGIVSIPRRIEGVDVAVAFRENPSGTYKISVRTGEAVNASAICETFGGGGHIRAARMQCARPAGACQRTAAGSSEKGTGRRMRDGIICIDKPAEHTSFDVIAPGAGNPAHEKSGPCRNTGPDDHRGAARLSGAGHKACDILPVQDKRYRARFQLGVTTDTQDCTGTVLERREVRVSREEFAAAIRSFEGEQMQLPPMYSAVQVGGRRLYDIAREGGTVERTPRPVTFYSIEILELGEDWAEIDVHCSKGSYIRTLCHDIGEKLGCGAMLTQLRRTMAAGFTEADCLTLEQLTALAQEGRAEEAVIPVERIFDCLPRLTLSAKLTRLFLQWGAALPVPVRSPGRGELAVWSEAGGISGHCRPDRESGRLVTRKLFKLL